VSVIQEREAQAVQLVMSYLAKPADRWWIEPRPPSDDFLCVRYGI
jgi:hypothetical protein